MRRLTKAFGGIILFERIEEVCPAVWVPSEDWGLDDPKGQPLEEVRAIRDEIRRRVEALLSEIKQDVPRDAAAPGK